MCIMNLDCLSVKETSSTRSHTTFLEKSIQLSVHLQSQLGWEKKKLFVFLSISSKLITLQAANKGNGIPIITITFNSIHLRRCQLIIRHANCNFNTFSLLIRTLNILLLSLFHCHNILWSNIVLLFLMLFDPIQKQARLKLYLVAHIFGIIMWTFLKLSALRRRH